MEPHCSNLHNWTQLVQSNQKFETVILNVMSEENKNTFKQIFTRESVTICIWLWSMYTIKHSLFWYVKGLQLNSTWACLLKPLDATNTRSTKVLLQWLLWTFRGCWQDLKGLFHVTGTNLWLSRFTCLRLLLSFTFLFSFCVSDFPVEVYWWMLVEKLNFQGTWLPHARCLGLLMMPRWRLLELKMFCLLVSPSELH